MVGLSGPSLLTFAGRRPAARCRPMGGRRPIVPPGGSSWRRGRPDDISHPPSHADWSASATARQFRISRRETKEHAHRHATVPRCLLCSLPAGWLSAAAGLSSRSEVSQSGRQHCETKKPNRALQRSVRGKRQNDSRKISSCPCSLFINTVAC